MSFNEEELIVWMNQTDKKLAHLEANQLAIINGDFCDTNAESKEPRIKDEKIRKAVRIWAEINSIEEVIYAERADRSLCNLTDMGDYDFCIEFVGWIPTLKDGEVYTIAELCGEEEE